MLETSIMLSFKQFLLETDSVVSGRHISIHDLSSAAKRGDIAKKLGVKASDLKTMSDSDIETILQDVGEHDFAPDSEFDSEQLKKGIEIEFEHTNSKLVAKLIAKDHIKEIPDYYTRLGKMEKEAEKND